MNFFCAKTRKLPVNIVLARNGLKVQNWRRHNNVVHPDNSAGRIKGDPKETDWYYSNSYLGWDPSGTYNDNPP
jgi:hypothetical protein